MSLRNRFPRFFSISANKEAKVGQVGSWEDDCWTWNLQRRRNFFAWEETLVQQLQGILSNANLAEGEMKSGASDIVVT